MRRARSFVSITLLARNSGRPLASVLLLEMGQVPNFGQGHRKSQRVLTFSRELWSRSGTRRVLPPCESPFPFPVLVLVRYGVYSDQPRSCAYAVSWHPPCGVPGIYDRRVRTAAFETESGS